jgi:hypothetical protein
VGDHEAALASLEVHHVLLEPVGRGELHTRVPCERSRVAHAVDSDQEHRECAPDQHDERGTREHHAPSQTPAHFNPSRSHSPYLDPMQKGEPHATAS